MQSEPRLVLCPAGAASPMARHWPPATPGQKCAPRRRLPPLATNMKPQTPRIHSCLLALASDVCHHTASESARTCVMLPQRKRVLQSIRRRIGSSNARRCALRRTPVAADTRSRCHCSVGQILAPESSESLPRRVQLQGRACPRARHVSSRDPHLNNFHCATLCRPCCLARAQNHAYQPPAAPLSCSVCMARLPGNRTRRSASHPAAHENCIP